MLNPVVGLYARRQRITVLVGPEEGVRERESDQARERQDEEREELGLYNARLSVKVLVSTHARAKLRSRPW